jgi:hypothetical protein
MAILKTLQYFKVLNQKRARDDLTRQFLQYIQGTRLSDPHNWVYYLICQAYDSKPDSVSFHATRTAIL